MKLAKDFPGQLEGYLRHLRGYYARGKYATDDAIHEAICQGKVFVFRLTPAARVRRGTATIEPLIGEVLDPGEMVRLLAAHPGVFFHFGVMTGGTCVLLTRNGSKLACVKIQNGRPR